MALRVMFVLAVLLTSFLEIQVLAQNSTTIAPSPSSSISPVASSTVSGPEAKSTSAPTPTPTPAGTPEPTPTTPTPTTPTPTIPFETNLMIAVTLGGECQANTSDVVKKWVAQTYADGYNIKDVKVDQPTASGENCKVNFTVIFESGLTQTDIVAKFENASKAGLNNMKVTLDGINVHVDDIILGDYKASDDDCKAKCCDGGGGPIEMTRTCKPEIKCGNYKVTMMESDCSKVCDPCSAGMSLQVSLMILIFAGLLNWLLKE